ncbi:hypothetical protein HYC85_020130 [Camellia sinensis]|uniref:DNA/RNA-binding protein Alba-like domain-containing protein n=1 Tax=Camellia sinensis TaxID=4442 RepID=A0A7J7GSU0_CAMSI|nr:hypothetical protein HYC85_020130 [Camellia sinensis]
MVTEGVPQYLQREREINLPGENEIVQVREKIKEKGSNEIALKAMGRATNKTVMIAELIKVVLLSCLVILVWNQRDLLICVGEDVVVGEGVEEEDISKNDNIKLKLKMNDFPTSGDSAFSIFSAVVAAANAALSKPNFCSSFKKPSTSAALILYELWAGAWE